MDQHRLVTSESGRFTCVCGWEPELGTSVNRGFDKHLLAVREEMRNSKRGVLVLVFDEVDQDTFLDALHVLNELQFAPKPRMYGGIKDVAEKVIQLVEGGASSE